MTAARGIQMAALDLGLHAAAVKVRRMSSVSEPHACSATKSTGVGLRSSMQSCVLQEASALHFIQAWVDWCKVSESIFVVT